MYKYQKGFAPIIITLIVLLLAGVGGTSYYLINKQLQKQTVCTMDAKICPDGSSVGRTGPNCEFAACPEVKIDETADWKTYNDEEYGFSFKYPAEYEVIKDTSYNIKYKIIGKNGFEQILYIDSSDFSSSSRLKELLEGRPKIWESSRMITVNGYNAVEIMEDNYGKTIKEVYIGKDNLVVTFQFNLDSLESKISSERQSILDSFRFIEKDGMVNWKTYTDNQYGYEIKYPSLYDAIKSNTRVEEVIIGTKVVPAYSILIEFNQDEISPLEKLKSSMEESLRGLAPANLKIIWKDTMISGEKAIEMSYEGFAGGYTGVVHETAVIKNNTAYIIKINYGGSEEEYYKILSTFKFIDEIKTGNIKIDQQSLQNLQSSVDQGHQPWRLDPESVVRADVFQYGFVQSDISLIKLISHAASSSVNEYEISHNNKTYIVSVIQAVPREGSIWTISSIKLK
ncbi:MAG TPA: hypothetical protein PLD14_03565 [Candidatus Pacearchaeota archaeon]|nr:hypothetical protein [Candidatus Pacearchaeota archaeon]HPR80274.1 hypothetical protein [Candidatus Pacearchaeota archaeon]